MIRRRSIRAGSLAALVGMLTLTSCEVKNPGAILDVDLDDEQVLDALVTGMSSDFSTMVDDIAFDMARGSDEMTGSGSYFETGLLRHGILNREDQNFEWGAQHRARWVAEAGLQRMDSVLGADYSGDARVARAFLLAGLSHRFLGETTCYAVIDGSGVLDHKVHFDSAVARADSAIFHAQGAGDAELVTAAYGLRAQANAGGGDWTAAVSDAGQVPTDFEYVAFFAITSGREENVIQDETWDREEMSAFNTVADRLAPDPRAPWVDEGATGADGVHAHYKQTKYPDDGSDIPVIKGTEMRLLEAEAFLRNSDLGNAVLRIDEARAHYGLGNVTPAPTTINDAWVVLDHERLLTLWMEGRRWNDARRWDEEGMTSMPAVQYIYGNPMTVYSDPNPLIPIFPKDGSIVKRATCIPISLAECDTNENLVGAPECAGAYVAP